MSYIFDRSPNLMVHFPKASSKVNIYKKANDSICTFPLAGMLGQTYHPETSQAVEKAFPRSGQGIPNFADSPNVRQLAGGEEPLPTAMTPFNIPNKMTSHRSDIMLVMLQGC